MRKTIVALAIAFCFSPAPAQEGGLTSFSTTTRVGIAAYLHNPPFDMWSLQTVPAGTDASQLGLIADDGGLGSGTLSARATFGPSGDVDVWAITSGGTFLGSYSEAGTTTQSDVSGGIVRGSASFGGVISAPRNFQATRGRDPSLSSGRLAGMDTSHGPI